MFGGDEDEERIKRGSTASTVAGLVTGGACWAYIDGAATGAPSDNVTAGVSGYSWLLPLLALLAYLLINGMSWTQLVDEESGTRARARLFLLLAVFIQLAALAVSGLIMGTQYLDKESGVNKWSGISIFASVFLITLAAWGQRLATLPPKDETMTLLG